METAEIQLLDPRPITDAAPLAPGEPAKTAVAVVDLKAIALSRFGNWRADAAALVKKFAGVAFAVTTPKGYEEATKARAEVRAPRYAAQRVSKASKTELAEISRAIGAEEAAVIAALKETEDAIDLQIKVEDDRRSAEKERMAEAEKARKAAHEARIEKIRGYVQQAAGKPSAVILEGVRVLEARAFPREEWEEFAEQAFDARDQVCVTLREMAAAAKLAEDEAAEMARVKAEQARIAEEQAAERKRLDDAAEEQRRRQVAQQEVIAKQLAEIAVAQKALADAQALADAAAQKVIDDAEALRLKQEAEESPINAPAAGYFEQHLAADHDGDVAPLPAVVVDLAEPSADQTAVAEEPLPIVPPAPPINLGTIESRLGFRLTREFIEVTLGLASSHQVKAAVFWAATDWPAIKSALIYHVGDLA